MCTLVVAARIVPGFSLVIIANRDEDMTRPSRPPFRWDAASASGGGFLAPRDERAGGTWLGWNDNGVFVGITNRHEPSATSERAARPGLVSRGALVVEALAGKTAADIHDAMGRLDPKRYNGFHLVYADDRDVFATIADGHELSRLTLDDGLSIVTERSFGAGHDLVQRRDPKHREDRVRRAWARLAGPEPFDAHRITRLLTEHDELDPLAATCVHLDGYQYGTRSAMVLAVPNADAIVSKPTMLWAEGPPCTTPFAEVDVPTDVSRTAKRG